MEIKYGLTGNDRKALVMAIAEITGADAIYKGVPTCNYEVGYFMIDKFGTLIFDDSADSEKWSSCLKTLRIKDLWSSMRYKKSKNKILAD